MVAGETYQSRRQPGQRLKLGILLLLPFAAEDPGEAHTHEPGVTDIVGVVVAIGGIDLLAFDFKFVVTDATVTAVGTHSDGAKFQAKFQFGIEGRGKGAVVTVPHRDRGLVVHVIDFEVGSQVEIDEVKTETNGGNQVDESILAKELPAEHPVCTVGKPAHVVQRELHGGRAVFGGGGIRRTGAFRCLGRHEVDVEPGEELLVLGTDVHVHAEVVVVEGFVLQIAGILGAVARRVLVVAVQEGRLVHVLLVLREHAAVVGADRDKSTNVFLLIEARFGIRKGARRKSHGAQQGRPEKRGYFCLHKRLPKGISRYIKYIMFGPCGL